MLSLPIAWPFKPRRSAPGRLVPLPAPSRPVRRESSRGTTSANVAATLWRTQALVDVRDEEPPGWPDTQPSCYFLVVPRCHEIVADRY